MVSTYRRGAINIALSFPLYLIIIMSLIVNKSYLTMNVVSLSIIYIFFISIMYKLFTNKNRHFYNIGQFIALFINFLAFYYIFNANLIDAILFY